jgi:hypothetical protein
MKARISESVLNRRTNNMPYEREHPLTGECFGDFHRQKKWVGRKKTFDLTQFWETGTENPVPALRFFVREYDPPSEPDSWLRLTSRSGREMRPVAICDHKKATDAIMAFIDQNVGRYALSEKYVDWNDFLICGPFEQALQLLQQSKLSRLVLRFWTAARFIEGGWKACGPETLGVENLPPPIGRKLGDSRLERRLHPHVSHQFTAIMVAKVLPELRKSLLAELEKNMSAKSDDRSRSWFETTIAVFVLMHSTELTFKHEAEWAAKMDSRVRSVDTTVSRTWLIAQ